MPRPQTSTPEVCANLSGAVKTTPLPCGPAVPIDATTARSMRWPVLMVSVSLTLRLASAVSLMLVAPLVVEAASVVWVAALSTDVTVAISVLPPKSMLIFSPTANPSALCTGRFVVPAGKSSHVRHDPRACARTAAPVEVPKYTLSMVPVPTASSLVEALP